MSRKRVAILISGTGSNMIRLIESMAAPDHPAEPAVVISDRADAPGLARAAELGVPVRAVERRNGGTSEFEARLQALLEEADTGIVCLAGFMRILGADFVARWAGAMLNIHPSLLPLFKGLDTHRRAIESGMAVHGCTVHEVTPELDSGPILGQAVIPILPDDTPEALAARLLPVEHSLYPLALHRFASGNKDRFALL